MAQIKPFRALRYTAKAGDPAALVCPPRAGERERAEHRSAGPWNAAHFLFPENGPSALLREGVESGILRRDTAPGVFIYERESIRPRETMRGLICPVKAEPEFLLSLEESRGGAAPGEPAAQAAAAAALYDDEERAVWNRIALLAAGTPRQEFSFGGAVNRLWAVNDRIALAAFREDFEPRRLLWMGGLGNAGDFPLLFLLDAAQSSLSFRASQVLLSSLPVSEADFFAACGPYFDVIPRRGEQEIAPNLDALYRQGRKAFAWYSGGRDWSLLLWKNGPLPDRLLPGKSEAYRALDCSVLRALLLEALLRIPVEEGSGAPAGLSLVPSVGEAIGAVQEGAARAALLTNPPRLRELRAVAAAGEKLPPDYVYLDTPPAGMVMACGEEPF